MASSIYAAWAVLFSCLLLGVLSQPGEEGDHDDDGHHHHHHHHHPPGHHHHHHHHPGHGHHPGGYPEVPGETIEMADAAYMASVHHRDTFLGAGVIISPFVILCSDLNLGNLKNGTENVTVRTGEAHRDHDGVVYGVSIIAIVGKFALLRTAEPIEFNENTSSIALPEQGEQFNEDSPAYIIGWGHPGRTDFEEGPHTFLKRLTVTLESHDYCLDMYSEDMYNSTCMLCVSGHEGCTGSSPLIQNDKVVGFDGDSCGCSEEGLPERFDALSSHVDEIMQEMQAMSE